MSEILIKKNDEKTKSVKALLKFLGRKSMLFHSVFYYIGMEKMFLVGTGFHYSK